MKKRLYFGTNAQTIFEHDEYHKHFGIQILIYFFLGEGFHNSIYVFIHKLRFDYIKIKKKNKNKFNGTKLSL